MIRSWGLYNELDLDIKSARDIVYHSNHGGFRVANSDCKRKNREKAKLNLRQKHRRSLAELLQTAVNEAGQDGVRAIIASNCLL